MTSNKAFWCLSIALLAVMGAVMVASALEESQTVDEGGHLISGYTYVKTADYRLDPAHPPLSRILNVLPLLFVKLRLGAERPKWVIRQTWAFGMDFLYHNNVSADRTLFLARSVTIALTLLLGLVMALWARGRFGVPAALLALIFFAFDPNLIAHGRYITTDLPAALALFVASIAWVRYLETERKPDLVWAGLALGAALSTKFSCLLLIPSHVLLYLARWAQRRWTPPARGKRKEPPPSLRPGLTALVEVAGIGFLVMALFYAPATLYTFSTTDRLADLVDQRTGATLYDIAKAWNLPAHPLLVGLEFLRYHSAIGHNAYLMGQISMQGWWYYFPVAFLVKTPLAVLLSCLIAAWLVVRLLFPLSLQRLREQFCRLPVEWLVLVLPPSLYFLTSMNSKLNIGVRHILPIYPFLFVFLAAILFRFRPFGKRFIILVGLLGALEIVESSKTYPDYLAFFNWGIGGSDNGAQYLLDSNIDWGQDLKKLAAYLKTNGIDRVCMQYFGVVDPAYYGIAARPLPFAWQKEDRAALDCIAAISVTPLNDVYVQPGAYRWLQGRQPMAIIGHSIYLFDLRKNKTRSA